MPRRGIQNSGAAAIDIIDFQWTYVPGDTILGHVVSNQTFAHGADAEKALVKLTLFGRAKSKIIRKTSNSKVTYRGRSVFFQEEQCIFRGAITADARIPFAITIPETSVPGFESRGDTWDKENDSSVPAVYLSTTQEDVTKHKLPSVYYFGETSSLSGSKYQAFVEYVLEAALMCPGAADVTATFPLLVRRPSTEKPIAGHDYRFHMKDDFKTIKTERLLPENSERKMTLREKSRRLFTPAKTPRYTYTVKIVHPQTIQLDHPAPIPFKIYIVPLLKHELTTICPDGDIRQLPPVEFVSMDLTLQSVTRLRCPTTFSETSTDRTVKIPIPFSTSFKPFTFRVPTVVRGDIKNTATPDYGHAGFYGASVDEKHALSHSVAGPYYLEEGSLRPAEEGGIALQGPIEYSRFIPRLSGNFFLGTPFDLGSHLDIRLTETGSSTLGDFEVPFDRQIFPTFATYNIALAHELVWNIRLVCAGEEHHVCGRADVEILPPSEEQEACRKRELGTRGMKKKYDDLMEAAEMVMDGLDMVSNVLQLVAGL